MSKTFKIHVRQYANGAVYALTDFEMSEQDSKSGVAFNDIVDGPFDNGPFREFAIDVAATPPHADTPTLAEVTVPTVAQGEVAASAA